MVDEQARRRGSPPRVWGKLLPVFGVTDIDAVHPHACGENDLPSFPAQHASRFTPTRVGKTVSALPVGFLLAVHPHACGENAVADCAGAYASGSPPRVWGKRLGRGGRGDWYRFTPTRVGKTRMGLLLGEQPPVHPHACGENRSLVMVLSSYFGSPPRVWGKRYRDGD